MSVNDNVFRQTITPSGEMQYAPIVMGETPSYPRCQLGDYAKNYAHDFTEANIPRGHLPLLYCRQCGQVRRLELQD